MKRVVTVVTCVLMFGVVLFAAGGHAANKYSVTEFPSGLGRFRGARASAMRRSPCQEHGSGFQSPTKRYRVS